MPDPNMVVNAQERLDKLVSPDRFAIAIMVDPALVEQLTASEIERLRTKLELVANLAAKLASNMLKGTIKYVKDEWSVDTWIDYLLDDAADVLNYGALLRAARQKETESAKSSIADCGAGASDDAVLADSRPAEATR